MTVTGSREALDADEQSYADLRASGGLFPEVYAGTAYGIIDPDYARIFTIARCLAWAEGYALAMHGSFTRAKYRSAILTMERIIRAAKGAA